MTKEPIEAVIARLREKRPHWSEAVQDDLYWASEIEADLSRLLDYVEGMRARIRELEEALIKIRGWREIDRETLRERLTAIEEICSAALNGEKAAIYINKAAQLRAKRLFEERTNKLQERFEQNNVQEV